MSGFSPKVYDMTAAALSEAQCHLKGLVDRFGASQPLKVVWPSIARKIGVNERRIRAIWHGEARAISSAEMDALRNAVRHQASSIYRDTIAHAERLEAAASALENIDADFHRQQVDQLRNAASALRGAVSHQIEGVKL